MKHFIVSAILMLLFTGCNKLKLDIPDTGRKIVINGLITTDELLNIRVSKSDYLIDSLHYGDPELEDLGHAAVKIYSDENYIDLLNYKIGGIEDFAWALFLRGNYYSTTLTPSPGTEYNVKVSYPGLPSASAHTIIPNRVDIEKTDTGRVLLEPGSFYEYNLGLKFKISFTDPANEHNYYFIKALMNTYYDTAYSYANRYSQEVFFKSNDPIVEENIENINGRNAIVFSDKMINGQKHSIDLIVKEESVFLLPEDHYIISPPGSYNVTRQTIYFKLCSINEEYYKYIQSLLLYSKNYGNPLAEPVMVNSNVEGGYGMFSGAAISTDSVVYEYKK